MLLSILHKYGIEQIPQYNASGRQAGFASSFGSSTKPIPL